MLEPSPRAHESVPHEQKLLGPRRMSPNLGQEERFAELEKDVTGAQLLASQTIAEFLARCRIDDSLRYELEVFRSNRRGLFRHSDGGRYDTRRSAVSNQFTAVPVALRRAVGTLTLFERYDESLTLLTHLRDRDCIQDVLDDADILLELLAGEDLIAKTKTPGTPHVLDAFTTALDLFQYANYHYLDSLRNRVRSARGGEIGWIGHHIDVKPLNLGPWPTRRSFGIIPLQETP